MVLYVVDDDLATVHNGHGDGGGGFGGAVHLVIVINGLCSYHDQWSCIYKSISLAVHSGSVTTTSILIDFCIRCCHCHCRHRCH